MKKFVFGQYMVPASQLFYLSDLTYGMVNIKPVVSGHVLVVPRRKVLRFKELTKEELHDFIESSQKIGSAVENHFNSTSLSFVIQDGKDAGQSVHHVHMHIMPRKVGDFKRNDEIYETLERVDSERSPRTGEEMLKEANDLRVYFPDFNSNQ